MLWQIALFLNVIFAVIRGSLYKKIVDKLDPYLVMFYTNVFGIATFGSYFILRYKTIPQFYLEMFMLGIIFTVSYGMYLTAIKISLSQSVVFSSYTIIIPLVLAALLLGEWRLFYPYSVTGIKNILGIILAFAAFYLIVAKGGKKEVKMEKRWLVLIGVNIILSGIGSFWSKSFLIGHSPSETLLSQFLGGMLIIPVLTKMKKVKLAVSEKNILFIIFISIIEFFTLILFYEAYKKGPVMAVLPVQALSVMILTAISGLLFFKEAYMFKREKLLGLIIGILGVGLLVI